MTEYDYINIYTDPSAKLTQVRNILDAFDTLQLELIEKGAVKEYTLNDGQVKISREYGSLKEISDSRLSYEQLANRLIEKIEGRQVRILPC